MEKLITLNTGNVMPVLGLGLYKSGEDTASSIRTAVQMGYRLFDTASAYKNEEQTGAGIRSCGLARDDLFVTTKVWNTAQRIGDIEGAFSRSLERLGLDYVDLYLIHWPVPGCYLETWRAMEKIYRSGRARAIGVSNFSEAELRDLMEHSDVMPAVNQIEYHPLWNRDPLRTFCQDSGIAVQAYAPLARGAYLDRDILVRMAEKYHRSTAQIGLRWLVQKGAAVIPKSVRPDRPLENSQIFDFELEEAEMTAIDGLNENFRAANIPDDLRI